MYVTRPIHLLICKHCGEKFYFLRESGFNGTPDYCPCCGTKVYNSQIVTTKVIDTQTITHLDTKRGYYE